MLPLGGATEPGFERWLLPAAMLVSLLRLASCTWRGFSEMLTVFPARFCLTAAWPFFWRGPRFTAIPRVLLVVVGIACATCSAEGLHNRAGAAHCLPLAPLSAAELRSGRAAA